MKKRTTKTSGSTKTRRKQAGAKRPQRKNGHRPLNVLIHFYEKTQRRQAALRRLIHERSQQKLL